PVRARWWPGRLEARRAGAPGPGRRSPGQVAPGKRGPPPAGATTRYGMRPSGYVIKNSLVGAHGATHTRGVARRPGRRRAERPMILVTGASGTVGSEVLKALGAMRARVRAAYRTHPPDLPAGVEAVALDYDR